MTALLSRIPQFYVLSILSVLCGIQLLSNPHSVQAETVFIEIQTAKLRREPKAWASPVADVTYGDEVTIVETQTPWLKVRTTKNVEGFIHSTAITARQVVLKSTATPGGAIGSFEAVLAGKGFSSEVTQSYAKKRSDVDLGQVDAMRKRSSVSDREVYVFMKQGGLNVTDSQ